MLPEVFQGLAELDPEALLRGDGVTADLAERPEAGGCTGRLDRGGAPAQVYRRKPYGPRIP